MPRGLALTYMLPTTLSLVPDRDIKLGMLISLSYTKPCLPDPDCNLTDSPNYVWPGRDVIKSDIEEPWTYDDAYKRSVSGGIWADIPILTAICGSLGFERSKSEDITVQAQRVETSWFTPNSHYIASALREPSAQEHFVQDPRARVFMITGMKIAYNAEISFGIEKAKEFHGDVGVDLAAVSAPTRVGPEAAMSRSRETHFHTRKAGPFVLAYQLKQIRKKRNGSIKVEGHNRDAFLFNDDDVVVAGAKIEFEDEWEVEEVAPETELAGV
ncbi:hypothetical protein Q7P35_002232 [Cladosporium inversicolor]